MPIVKFQQDTTKPFGTGNFVDDQGRSMYLTDPAKASQFVDTLPGQGGGASPAGEGQHPEAGAGSLGLSKVGGDVPNPDTTMQGVQVQGAPTPPPANPNTPMGKIQAFVGMGGAKAAPAAPGAPPVPGAPPGAPPAPPGATGAPAAPAPAVAAPAAPSSGPGVLELAGQTTTSSTSTSVQQGRDKGAVAAQIGAEEQAGAATDQSLLDQAKGADERTEASLGMEREGLAGAEERNRNRVIDEQLKQQEIGDKLAQLNKELKENDEKMDPDRHVKNMSTGKRVSMTILAALNGAFGALSGNKENGVLQELGRQIDVDIQKQKDEIAAGRVRIGNDIAEFMRKGHDAETAEQLARDRADSAVDKMFELDAKRMGIQGANLEQAQSLVKQRAEARAARRGDLLAQTEDRISKQSNTTTVKTLQQKQAGGKPMSEKEYYDTRKAELDYRNAALDSANTADIAKAIGKPISPQEAQRIKDRVKEVGVGINETSGAVDMTANLVESLGGKLDRTTGKIEWPSDMKGAGWWDSSNVVGAPLERAGLVYTDATKVRDSQAALKEFVTSNLTGATASPEQLKTFTTMVGADLGNEERAKQNIQNWANTLFSLRNTQMARLGDDGQRWFAHTQETAKRGSAAPPLVPR